MGEHKAIGQTAFLGFRKWHKASKRLRLAAYCFGLILVIVFSVLLEVVGPISNTKNYHLSAAALQLTGESRDDTVNNLKLNKEGTAFAFTVPEVPKEDKAHSGRNENAYSVNLAKNPKEGITYTDTSTNISIGISPSFFTLAGDKVGGDHIVYPFGPNQLTYTLKYNGLKEDIIISDASAAASSYSFELRLPAGVDARMDRQGNIGLYSADTSLYGQVTYGSDDDRELLDKARENGQKTHLLATIPAPVVKDATGQEYTDKASFRLEFKTKKTTESTDDTQPVEIREKFKQTLNIYQLKINTRDLKNLTYPISIDPTIQSKDAAEFNKINLEGGVDVDQNSGLIKRGSLTGGTVGSWTNDDTNVPATGSNNMSTVYNGKVYWAQNTGNIFMASIDAATGNIIESTFTDTGVAINGPGRTLNAYNGYLYMGNSTTNIKYTKLNSDGTLNGSLISTTSPSFSHDGYAMAIYNNYMYISGGYDQTGNFPFVTDNYYSTIYFSQINADGSLSTWNSAGANFSAGRRDHSMPVYNGYVYIVGGLDGTSNRADVQYTKITSNGTIGTWSTTTSLTGNTSVHGDVFGYNGYLYAPAGSSSSTQVRYASINADGTIGIWKNTTDISAASGGTSFGYNNRIYVIGGTTSTNIQIGSISSVGAITSFADSGNNFTNARTAHASAAAYGYLYVAGGCIASSCSANSSSNLTNTVYKAAINSDGTLGAWSSVSSFSNAREELAMQAYGGYLYISGGVGFTALGGGIWYDDVQYASITPSTGALSSWTTDSDRMGDGRYGHQMQIYNGKLYVISGHLNGVDASNSVEMTTINTDNGSIGAFSPATALPSGGGRQQFASVVYNDRMYIIGGCTSNNCATNTASIYYADISTNGTLSSWTQLGTSLQAARWGHQAFASKGKLYVVGGCSTTSESCTTFLSSMEVATINIDKTLGSFSNATNSLGTARVRPGGAVYNDRLYITGGCSTGNCSTFNNTTEYAQFNNGGPGNIPSWTSASNNFTTARFDHCTVAINSRLYVIGGQDSSNNMLSTVYDAAINSDGTVGTWSANTSLPQSRVRMGCATYNGYIYLTGGQANGVATPVVTSVYGKPDSNGDIPTSGAGAWTTTSGTSNMTTARNRHGTVINNGYIYVLGGATASSVTNSVEYASLSSSNGSMGSWSNMTTNFTTARRANGAVVYNGYMYVIGGCTDTNNTCASALSDIQFTKLTSGGDSSSDSGCGSAWCYTTSLEKTVAHVNVIVYNGYLYLPGGFVVASSTAAVTDVRQVPILANGELGPTWSTSASFAEARYADSMAIYAGKLYVTGGGPNGATPRNTTYFGALNSIPRIAQFSRYYDFGKGVHPTKLITRGIKQTGSVISLSYMNNNNSGATFGAATSLSDISYDGSATVSLSLGTNVSLSRYLWVSYTIDDTYATVFPDVGDASNISAFDLYFTANPAARLRGGRTFTNGIDRGLNPSP